MGPDWHNLVLTDVLERLASRREGLSSAAADAVRRVAGPNILPEASSRSALSVIVGQLNSPMIYLLLIAAAVSAATGEWVDAAFVFLVLAINTALGGWQELQAESSARALRNTTRSTARIRRDGRVLAVDSSDIVAGDIVLLEAGDRVPADIRLIECSALRTDESLLTGESDLVDKDTVDTLPADAPLAERLNCLFAGTMVRQGRGEGIVVATATHTAVGTIAADLNRPQPDPPIVQRLARFTQLLGIVTIGIVLLFVVSRLALGGDLRETVLVSVALAISVIPEGLPVAITVALAVAARRMASRNVIVRKLPAVEGLGACTVIATDKTGTLTVNQLTARQVWLPEHGFVRVSGEGLAQDGDFHHAADVDRAAAHHAVRRLARTASLTNDATLDAAASLASGDSVDVALLVLAAKASVEHRQLRTDAPRVIDMPFEPERRYSASLNRHEDGHRLHVKGAPEVLLPLCANVAMDEVSRAVERMAADGYRVVALARRSVEEFDAGRLDAHLHDLQFLGLVGFSDPLRPEAEAAVAACHRAGVTVKMITGDHATTALSIARQLGIAADATEVVTGGDVARAAGDPVLMRQLARANVFARVEPGQKADIVRALRSAGHFVAMTGDGVNDAPALVQADIGIAMGISGTDVAREAADLVLADDNFSSIVGGIEEGRAAYDNIRKVIYLLVATGFAEVVLFLLAISFGLPLPLGAVQLLWLNLITNGGQDVALAFEAPEERLLSRPPRSPAQPLFDGPMIAQVLLSGLYMGSASFGVFAAALWFGASEAEARNMVLFLLVLFENVQVFNVRSERRSTFTMGLSRNWLLIIAVAAAQLLQFAAPFVPGLSVTLGVELLPAPVWLALFAVALTVLPLMEAYKVIVRRSEAENGRSIENS